MSFTWIITFSHKKVNYSNNFVLVSEPLNIIWWFFCWTFFMFHFFSFGPTRNDFWISDLLQKHIIFNMIILWGSLNYLLAQLQPELTVIFLIFVNWRFESKKATSIFDLSWRHLKKKIHRINWIQFQSISPVKRLLTWTSPVAAVKFCYDL